MRLGVVSDIHGNLTALEAVIVDIERRAVDRVVHGGDLVLMGCQPAEVVDRIRELGWPGIVGNTDELLWRPEERAMQERSAPKRRESPATLILRTSHAHRDRRVEVPRPAGHPWGFADPSVPGGG